MKTSTILLIGGGATLFAAIFLRPKAASTSRERPQRAMPKPCRAGFRRVGKECIRPPKPDDTPSDPVPMPTQIDQTPAPPEIVAGLCTNPLKLEPPIVGKLLANFAVPAYRASTGGEFAPSESTKEDARDAVIGRIRGLCQQPIPGVSTLAEQLARGAEAIDVGGRYAPMIDSETAIGRLCNWDGEGGSPLDSTQVIVMIVDIVFDGLRKNQNRKTLADRLTKCTMRDAPANPISARQLAELIVDVAIAVREATK